MGGGQRDVGQAGGFQTRAELRERQRARDAADERATLGSFASREPILGDDVGHAHPTTRSEHAGDLAEDGRLVRGQVDHAVADDDVDRRGGQRDRLDLPADELDVRRPGLGRVPLGQREHLVGHVEPDTLAGRADPLGREQHVDPAAGPQVEDALALAQLRDGGRIAAAERREHRRLRQLGLLERRVEPGADRLRRAAATGHRRRLRRRRGVMLADVSWIVSVVIVASLLWRRVVVVGALILVDIDGCQYLQAMKRSGDPDVLLLQAAADPTRPRDPAPARRLRRRVCLRLHGLLRRRPADGQPPPQGAARGRLGANGTAGLVRLLLPAAGRGRAVPITRCRVRSDARDAGVEPPSGAPTASVMVTPRPRRHRRTRVPGYSRCDTEPVRAMVRTRRSARLSAWDFLLYRLVASHRDALALTLAAAAWGIGTVISKRALVELDPLALLPVQLSASLVVLALLIRRSGGAFLGGPRALTRLGLLNPGLAYALGLLGLASITASLAVLLWAVEPLLILLLAAVLLRERITVGLALLSVAAVVGILLLIRDPAIGGGALGIALTLAGVACCALYTVLTRRWLPPRAIHFPRSSSANRCTRSRWRSCCLPSRRWPATVRWRHASRQSALSAPWDRASSTTPAPTGSTSVPYGTSRRPSPPLPSI